MHGRACRLRQSPCERVRDASPAPLDGHRPGAALLAPRHASRRRSGGLFPYRLRPFVDTRRRGREGGGRAGLCLIGHGGAERRGLCRDRIPDTRPDPRSRTRPDREIDHRRPRRAERGEHQDLRHQSERPRQCEPFQRASLRPRGRCSQARFDARRGLGTVLPPPYQGGKGARQVGAPRGRQLLSRVRRRPARLRRDPRPLRELDPLSHAPWTRSLAAGL